MAIATNDTNTKEKAANFLEEIIQESIAKGDTRVQTRFPPEPNGYLHIGHAKSICINFGLAKKYGGKCNLRFDDTNPVKEDVEYVDSIKRDIRWLGFDWALERYASDYFDQLYDWAVVLIKKGLAYVDDQTQEEIRLTRGTVSEPGKESPWRNRSVEENLDLFERMKKGEFADGEKVFPHVFGTDRYGRDIMVRTMFATRVSMIIGLTAALIVLVIGALYGSISGFFGGTVDVVMQRIVDVIYSLPDVLIILLIATAMGPHVTQFITDHQGFFLAEFFKKVGPNLMGMFIAFACLYWVGMSRIIRGQILTLKKQEYVTAARALGASSGRIIKRHLLPNCIGQIVATTCLQIPSAIFTESFMSFLGVGVLAPLTSLGSMCSDALGGISTYPYRLIIPAIIISIMILSFNLFGDGLRDALDPRLKK